MLTRAWYAAAAASCLMLWGAPAVRAVDEPPTTAEKDDTPVKPKDEAKPADDSEKPNPKDEAAPEKAEKPGKPEIAWVKSYDDAIAQARKVKKLVMVDVYTDWCGWCKRLDADTYSNAKVVEQAGQFVSVKVNAEKKGGKEVATKFEVRGFPTILFLNPDTKSGDPEVEATIGGYMPPGPFAERIRLISDAHRDYPALQKRVEDDPEDLEALGKLVVIQHMRKDEKRAAELLDQGLKKDPENAKGQLTKALNAVADQHQEAREFDEAIALFRKAADTGKEPSDVAYARASIAVCLASQGKFQEAIPELEAVRKVPGASKEEKAQAEMMLKQLQALEERVKKAREAEEKVDEPKAEDKKTEEKKGEDASEPKTEEKKVEDASEPKTEEKKGEKDEPNS